MSPRGDCTHQKRPYSSGFNRSEPNEETAVAKGNKRIKLNQDHDISFFQRLRNVVNWVAESPLVEFFTSAFGMETNTQVIDVSNNDTDTYPNTSHPKINDDTYMAMNKEASNSIRHKFRNQRTFASLDSIMSNPEANDGASSSTSKLPFFSFNKSYSNPGLNTAGNESHLEMDSDSNSRNEMPLFGRTFGGLQKSGDKTQGPLFSKISQKSYSQPDISQSATEDQADDVVVVMEKKAKSSASSHIPSFINKFKKMQRKLASNNTANELIRHQEKAYYESILKEYYEKEKQNPTVYQPVPSCVIRHDNDFIAQTDPPSLTDYVTNTLKYRKSEGNKLYFAKPSEIQLPDIKVKLGRTDLAKVKAPLPKYKPRRVCTATPFSEEWLSELKFSMDEMTKERMKIERDRERQLEIIVKKREQQRKVHASCVSSHLDLGLPEITEKMHKLIDMCFSKPANESVSGGKNSLLQKDLESLQPDSWLNDQVINCYLNLICARSKRVGYPSVYAFDTFFYTKLKSNGFQAVRRWTRKKDIFGFDLLLIPAHLGIHWCLVVVDFRSRRIQYYDSLNEQETMCGEILRTYLREELLDKKQEDWDFHDFAFDVMKNIPKQDNGVDCGVFTLKYSEYIARNAQLNFRQSNMQYFRRLIQYELITNTLLTV